MNTYMLLNLRSGMNLGTYEADDEEDALDSLAYDAGYANHEAACEVADGGDVVARLVAMVDGTLAHGVGYLDDGPGTFWEGAFSPKREGDTAQGPSGDGYEVKGGRWVAV